MSDKRKVAMKCIVVFLLLGALAVSIKMLFCGYTADDAYLVTMSYRRAMGDRLFMEMWEPHQTSAFLCAGLIKLYVTLFGSVDYIVLFLRACGLLFHAGAALFLYQNVKLIADKEYAFVLAVLSYSLFPKLSVIPEYSDMNYWFLTISLCFLLRAFLCHFEKPVYMVLSASFLSLLIVTYPTAIIVFAAYFAGLLCIKEGRRLKAVGVLCLTCICEAVLYVVAVFAGKDIKTVLYNMGKIVTGDSSHLSGFNVAGQNAVENYIFGIIRLLLWSAIVFAVSLIIALVIKIIKRKEIIGDLIFAASLVCSFCLMAFICVTKQTGFDCTKIQYILIPVEAVAVLFLYSYNREPVGKMLLIAMSSGYILLIGICLVSNLQLDTNIPHLQVALIWGLVAVYYVVKDKKPIRIALVVATVISIGFTGYVQKPTAIGKNIFQYNAINNSGPAKRVVCDWTIKGNYESTNEEIKSIVKKEDSLFIVSNNLYAPPTELFMVTDAKIGQYSTQLTTPTYGETHMDYWEEFPDRLPTIVAVGKDMEELFEESVACKWLFDNYRFELVLDGTSYYFYRRVE